MPLRTLSNLLRRERHLVDLVEHGVSDRFALQLLELERALVVDDVAREFAFAHDVSLRTIAAQVPEPWSDVLDGLHASLVASDLEVLPRSLADFLR